MATILYAADIAGREVMLVPPWFARLVPVQALLGGGFAVIGVGYAMPHLAREVQPMDQSSPNFSPQTDAREASHFAQPTQSRAVGLGRWVSRTAAGVIYKYRSGNHGV